MTDNGTEPPWTTIRRAAALVGGPAATGWLALVPLRVAQRWADWMSDAADAAEEHAEADTAGVGLGKTLCANETKALALARALLEE